MATTNQFTAEADITVNSLGWNVSISFPNAGVDRPCSGSTSCGGDRKLADRLASAIRAGVAMSNMEVRTDVNGKTYVAGTRNFMGRTLNRDLNRLGF